MEAYKNLSEYEFESILAELLRIGEQNDDRPQENGPSMEMENTILWRRQ